MKGWFVRYIVLIGLLFLSDWAVEAQHKHFTLVIDAGHGGKDPGARGVRSREKDINLGVALKLGQLVRETYPDVRVLYTRQSDRFVELNERAEIANRNKADLFISIHTNSVKRGSRVCGTETYTLGLARSDENLEVAMRENAAILLEDDYKQRYEGFDPSSTESYIIFEFMQNKHMEQSVLLASEIQKAFLGVNRVDRGVRQAGFLVLRKTSMPSVLIELGFISNPAEEQYMSSEVGQKALAASIAKAFGHYKHAFDQKQIGTVTAVSNVSPAPRKQNVERETEHQETSGKHVFRVQIMTSEKQLAPDSRYLKGYKPVYIVQENGLYKYMYGESTSFDEIRKIRRRVLKDFKDAFIVAFKDGKRVNY